MKGFFMISLLIYPIICLCQTYGSFTDPRDGRQYKTIEIGGNIWMAENLAYKVDDSWCYEDEENNAGVYGRLYSWQSAKEACPEGWHIPTEEDWQALEMALGMPKEDAVRTWGVRGTDQGTLLKEGGSSGMNVLLAGHRGPDGKYSYMGNSADFWLADEADEEQGWRRLIMDDNSGIARGKCDKKLGFSIRCVKDK